MIAALKHSNSRKSPQVRNTDDAGHLVVSTRFMESYELVKPVSGGGDLTTFLNLAGGLDVYSVGTTGNIYRTRPDSKMSGAWLEENLQVAASQLYVTALSGPTDNPDIFGLNSKGQLTQSVYKPAIPIGGYEQQVQQPPQSNSTIKQFRAATNLDNVYCNVILDSDEVATNFLKPDGSWASPKWGVMRVSGSQETVKAKRIAMCSNNHVQTSLYAIDMNDEVIFAENSSRFTQFKKLGKKAIDLAVVLDSENRLNIIIVDTNSKLWWKHEKKYSTGGIQWEDWVQLRGSNVVSLHAVQSAMDANGDPNEGLLEIFAVGTDSSLYHMRQVQADGGRVEWGALFPLGNPINATTFTVGKNGQGYSEVYSVTSDSSLYRFWQDPNTTQWTTSRVELQEATETTPLACHSVDIQVLDDAGLGIPQTEVKISTSSLTTVRINGLYYHISEYLPFKVGLDGAGTVVVERFTNTLSAPTLYVTTDFMTEGEGVTVEPNANLQDRLHATTPEEVLDARGADGEHLLKGAYRTPENAESIANIIRQSMSLGKPALPKGPGKYLSMNRIPTGLRFHGRGTGSPYRINPAEVEEQHWRVDLSSGFPVYEELDRDTAGRMLAQRQAAIQTQAQEFLGIDWGDIWQSIKEGVVSILDSIEDFIVTTIVDPITKLVKEIKVVFSIIVDGVTRFIDTTIEFFQQAFDIVEGIWNSIKVFFEDLYHWLRFVFDWKDIQRTAEAIEHSIVVTMDFLVEVIKYERKQVLEGINAFEDKIKASVDAFLESFSDTSTLGSYTTDQTEPEPALEVASKHNVLYSGFADNWNSTEITPGAQKLQDLESYDSLEKVFDELVKLADNFEFGAGKDAFDEAVAYIMQIGENPNDIVNLLFKATVKVGEAIALFGVAVAKGVILSLFDVLVLIVEAVKAVLVESWEIPFVSQLYKWITGKTLEFRPISLFSLITAVPGTVLYKIVFDKPPFTEASLKEFKNGFTVEWLAQQSGLPTDKSAAALQVSQAQVNTWRQMFAVLYSVTYAVRLLESMQVGLIATKGNSWEPLNVGIVFLRLCNSAFSIPWVMEEHPVRFDCSAKGFGNWIWTLQLCCGPIRGGLIAAVGPAIIRNRNPEWDSNQITQLLTYVNEGTLTVWGAIHLVMVIVQAAVDDDATAISVTKNVLTTLGPQTLRICSLREVNEGTYYIPLIALEIFIILGYPAIAGLNIAQYINTGEAVREMGFLPQPAMA